MTTFEDSTIVPCDMCRFLRGNLYKNVLVCIKRAREIELERFEDLSTKLHDWMSYVGEISFDGNYNVDARNEIAQFFENLEKPELVAIEEFEASRLKVEDVVDEEENCQN